MIFSANTRISEQPGASSIPFIRLPEGTSRRGGVPP
jgi:hypothetical protein